MWSGPCLPHPSHRCHSPLLLVSSWFLWHTTPFPLWSFCQGPEWASVILPGQPLGGPPRGLHWPSPPLKNSSHPTLTLITMIISFLARITSKMFFQFICFLVFVLPLLSCELPKHRICVHPQSHCSAQYLPPSKSSMHICWIHNPQLENLPPGSYLCWHNPVPLTHVPSPTTASLGHCHFTCSSLPTRTPEKVQKQRKCPLCLGVLKSQDSGLHWAGAQGKLMLRQNLHLQTRWEGVGTAESCWHHLKVTWRTFEKSRRMLPRPKDK